MAEHVRRVRRRRRVKRVRSGRLQFTPVRLAICGAFLLLSVVLALVVSRRLVKYAMTISPLEASRRVSGSEAVQVSMTFGPVQLLADRATRGGGSWGTGGPGWKVDAEFNDKPHELGVLSMARSSDPDSAGSQFFICLARVTHLDHQYTGFGKLIKGEDVLKKIGDTEVTMSGSGEKSKPTKRITVESIKIVPADSVK